MIRSVKILAVAAAVLMAAPAATAAWMSYGTFEPDVIEDVEDGWMFADPPTNHAEKRVYFNTIGMSGNLLVPAPTPNHNVGALHTRFEPTNQIFKAFLGVWLDCNDDGYVGLAESAVHAYRVELGQHDESICPVESTPTAHNDGTWIRELIPIGITNDVTNSSGTTPEAEMAVYLDETAMVWGDAGYPGEDLSSTGSGGSCPLNPLPRGTMQSTGGLLRYADCGVGVVGLYNTAVTTADPENEQGLAFADANNPDEAGHPLNVDTFGPEDSEQRAANVWDCESTTVDEEATVPAEDPTGFLDDSPGDGEFTLFTLTIPGLAPSAGPGSSIAGLNNHTQEGLLSDCDTSNDSGGDTYVLEGDHEGASTTNKNAANWDFRFYRAAFHPGYVIAEEGDDLIFEGDGLTPADVIVPSTGAPDLGVQALQMALGSYWSSNAVLFGTAPSVPARHGLTVNTTDPTQSPPPNPRTGANPDYYTFYAYVGSWSTLGFSLPGQGLTGDYADEWCDGATDGNFFGVECDANKWNRNADDDSLQQVPTGTVMFAQPGQDYNLRDIDCYDSTFDGVSGDCATQPLPTPAKDA